MTIGAIDESQRTAARVVGVLYLAMMATSIFFDVFVWRNIIVPGDAARTASNIMANERLFRTGVVFELVTCAGDIALLMGLYVLLEPVNQGLALLAAFWRLAESVVFGVLAIGSMVVLIVLGGANQSHAFALDQLQELARVAMRTHAAGFTVAFVFLGLGGALFSYLLFKSRYVPRAFGVLGVFAYILMLAYSVAIIIVPQFAVLSLAPYAPAGVFEIGCGLWFLVKGVRAPASAPRALEPVAAT